jgi:hypothetical protein
VMLVKFTVALSMSVILFIRKSFQLETICAPEKALMFFSSLLLTLIYICMDLLSVALGSISTVLPKI